MTLAELESHFSVSLDVFMARDGKARASGRCSSKKLCFVATDKELLVRLLLELSERDDCYWVKYSVHAHAGMYLGRCFLTDDETAGTLWARYKQAEGFYCSIQDDDFTKRFREGAPPDHRLATYGSLAPGRPNHHQLDGLDGRWFTGHVRGRLIEAGWGAALGFPAMVLDPEGRRIEVHVFESADLPAHWSRLDDFEGAGYRRIVAPIETADGIVEAFVYALDVDLGAEPR